MVRGCFLVVLASASWASAALRVEVGQWVLLPDRPGQTVDLLLTGAEELEGADLVVQVGDGGSYPGGPGINGGPRITDLSVEGGIFGPGVEVAVVDAFPQLWTLTVVTAEGSVSGDGRLARLTVDTTGVFSGTFDLKLTETLNLDTTFFDQQAEVVNGSIQILVPEPGAMGLAALAVWALLRRTRKAVASR